MPHTMTKCSKRNRRILSLFQRVQVIRDCDLQNPKPKIATLANKYNVSYKQIQNILLNRESILKVHQESGDNENIHRELHEEFLRRRQDKIKFLDRVMYEYLQRILFSNLSIDDELVLQKANEVKERIAVVYFKPTLAWLNKFKQTYGIPSFDLETLRNNVTLTEPKRHQLTTIDLIAYVSSLEQTQESTNRVSRTEGNQSQSPTRSISPSPVNYTKGRKIVKPKITLNNKKMMSTFENMQNCLKNSVVDQSNKQEITSLADVAKHLRLLEEYAMLQENYRAIGLLTQLEEVLQKPLKTK